MSTPLENLMNLGLKLPETSSPIANYVNAVRTGNLIYLSGKGPLLEDKTYITGKVGDTVSIEQGYAAARLCGLHHLAVLQSELGDLAKVKRIVKVLGLVNCVDIFTQHPAVMNGYSDLMAAVFGVKGKHARSAMGTNSLPGGIPVEVEVIVEVEV